MTTNRFASDPTFVELLAGVATGARDLASAHAAQLREELSADACRGLSAAITLATGVTLSAVGAVFMLVAVVFTLTDVVGWPPWAAWLTVGGLVLAAGAATIAAGIKLWKSYEIIPDQTIRSMGESLSWITNK